MTAKQAYMLNKGNKEIVRLDTYNYFLRQASHGHLVYSSIPENPVVDLKRNRSMSSQLVAKLPASSKERTFVNFDISNLQLLTTADLPWKFSPELTTWSTHFRSRSIMKKLALVNVHHQMLVVKGIDLVKVVSEYMTTST